MDLSMVVEPNTPTMEDVELQETDEDLTETMLVEDADTATLPGKQESDRDLQIIELSEPSSPTAASSECTMQANEEPAIKEISQPEFKVQIFSPRKIGVDGINAHTVYKTNCSLYRNSDMTVQRRYRDFLWLFDRLAKTQPGAIVPPLPAKSAIGRFQDEFVEKRRVGLELCLKRITSHRLLCMNQNLRLFLESERFNEEVEVIAKKENVERGLFSRLGNVVFSLSIPKFVENNQWIKAQMMQLDDYEAEMKLLSIAIENLIKQRKGLINSLELYIDAGNEGEEALAIECQNLVSVMERVRTIHEKITLCDVRNLQDTVDEYTRNLNSIRLAYTQRQHCFNAWKLAEKEARNCQTAVESDKSSVAELRQVARETNSQSQQDAFATQKRYNLATETLVDELRQWEVSRGEEIKQIVRCYSDAMIKGHREMIKIWKNLLQRTGEGNGKNEF